MSVEGEKRPLVDARSAAVPPPTASTVRDRSRAVPTGQPMVIAASRLGTGTLEELSRYGFDGCSGVSQSVRRQRGCPLCLRAPTAPQANVLPSAALRRRTQPTTANVPMPIITALAGSGMAATENDNGPVDPSNVRLKPDMFEA